MATETETTEVKEAQEATGVETRGVTAKLGIKTAEVKTGLDSIAIVGTILGTILIIVAIMMGGDVRLFLNFHSFMVVFGGTIATAFIAFPPKEIFSIMRVVINAYLPEVHKPVDYVEEIMQLSLRYRAGGMRRLENEEKLLTNRYLKNGISMIVDGYNSREIQEVMEREITALGSRHNEGQQILRFVAIQAPVFGMVGTVMGLIQMLSQLKDPATIGPNMSLALTATFYGLILNNFVATPIVAKLANRTEHEKALMRAIRAGVVGIHDRLNPHKIRRSMNTFLPPSQQK